MEIGNIVCSLAGHDKGIYYLVIEKSEKGIAVCDGKHHKLVSPKLKNEKHLVFTGHSVEMEKITSDKAVRRGIFAELSAYKEEE